MERRTCAMCHRRADTGGKLEVCKGMEAPKRKENSRRKDRRLQGQRRCTCAGERVSRMSIEKKPLDLALRGQISRVLGLLVRH